MNLSMLDLKQEPYLAELWVYLKSSGHTPEQTAVHLQRVTQKLDDFRRYSERDCASEGKVTGLSESSMHELNAMFVGELEVILAALQNIAKNTSIHSAPCRK